MHELDIDLTAGVQAPLSPARIRRAQLDEMAFLTGDREGPKHGLRGAGFKEELLVGGHRGETVEGVVAQDRRRLGGIAKNYRRCARIESTARERPITANAA